MLLLVQECAAIRTKLYTNTQTILKSSKVFGEGRVHGRYDE